MHFTKSHLFKISFLLLLYTGFGESVFATNILEQRYARCSNIFIGKIISAKFENKQSNSPVQKFFTSVEVVEVFKGSFKKKEIIKILVGGKTLYNGKIFEICKTNLPANTKRIFFLGYLFPNERAFSVNTKYFIDVMKIIKRDSVLIHNNKSRVVSLSEFRKITEKLKSKYDTNKIFNSSNTIVTGKIKGILLTKKNNYNIKVKIAVEKKLKGENIKDTIIAEFSDIYRRIHYRNRKISDIPFYITRNKTALNKERRNNFFLTINDNALFSLNKSDSTYIVNYGPFGIFDYNNNHIRNRWSSNDPINIDSLIIGTNMINLQKKIP